MNIQKLVQQAQAAQKQLKKRLDEFDAKEFEFNFKDLVKIKITGALEVKDIQIAKDIIDPTDPDTLQDLIIEAVNQAILDVSNQKNQIANSLAPSMGGMF